MSTPSSHATTTSPPAELDNRTGAEMLPSDEACHEKNSPGSFVCTATQCAAIVLLAATLFMAVSVLAPWPRKLSAVASLPIAWLVFQLLRRSLLLRTTSMVLGIGLMLLNLYGLAQPLRSPEVANCRDLQSIHGPQLGCAALEHLSEQQPSIDRREFAIKAARIVSRAIVFSLPESRSELARLHHIVPLEKNYLLWLASWTRPHPFARMEYFQWQRGAARGVGACSQAAMALCNYLNSHGFDCDVVGLDGHVVTRLNPETDPAAPLVLDPDQGIAFTQPLAVLEQQPEITLDRYLTNARTHATEDQQKWLHHAQQLAAAYSPEGNRVYDTAREYFGYATLVDQSRLLKWGLPLTLLLVCGLTQFYRPIQQDRRSTAEVEPTPQDHTERHLLQLTTHQVRATLHISPCTLVLLLR